MATSCDPNDLMAEASCLRSCLSPGMHPAAQTYLLAVIVGGSLDPETLLQEAKCFLQCIPPGSQLEVQVHLLCEILG
jgi:hypothetical protein